MVIKRFRLNKTFNNKLAKQTQIKMHFNLVQILKTQIKEIITKIYYLRAINK